MAQVEGQPAHGGDDAVGTGPLGRAFEGPLHQWLGRQGGRARRIDQRGDDRSRDRVEPLEPGIDLLGRRRGRGESHHDQTGAEPAPVQRHEPPTVTTELGVPNSSSRATGAAGSATQLTPSV